MQNTLGLIVKNGRECLGISQRELAKKLNVSYSLVCRIENGLIKKPSLIFLYRLCNLFDYDLREMILISGYTLDELYEYKRIGYILNK